MTPELLSIRQQMVSVIRSVACQGISFRYKQCIINGAQYLNVATHLEAGRITVAHIGPGGRGKAQYDDGSDTIFVQTSFLELPGLRQFDEPACVHELTHAVYDQQRLGWQPALDSEVVAYVAEQLYKIRAGIPVSQSTTLEVTASAIARFLAGRPGTVVTEGMARNLLTALGNHELYRDQRTLRLLSDGIGGRT